MAEDGKKNDLGSKNVTVSEYLLLSNPLFKGWFTPESGPGSSGAAVTLEGQHELMPDVKVYGRGSQTDVGKAVEAGFGLEKGPLSYTRNLLNIPKHERSYIDMLLDRSQKESLVTDRLKAEGDVLGRPVRFSYEKETQPGMADRRTRRLSGLVGMGPVEFFGEKASTTMSPIPEEYRFYYEDPRLRQKRSSVGVRGRIPIGEGILSGEVARTWLGSSGLVTFDDKVQDMRVDYRKEDPRKESDFGVRAEYRHSTRGRDIPSVSGHYQRNNLFGKEGHFRVEGGISPFDRFFNLGYRRRF